MKTISLIILIAISLRKTVQAMIKQSSKSDNELVYILFPTVAFILMYMEVI